MGFDAEAPLDLLHLRRHRGGIRRVAREHVHRQRATVPGTKQAEDDLRLTLLAVPVVAERGQGRAAPLEITGGHVVQQKGSALQVPSGQALLDPHLPPQQPVEHRQHLVATNRTEAEEGAEAGGGGLRGQAPGGGELGEGLEHPGDEGGEGKVAVAAAFAVQEAFETELAAETEEGGDMPMGQGAANGEGLAQRAKDLTALEQGADAVDDLRGSLERLARVVRRMRLPSRLASRKRMAGGLERLGMTST